MTRFFACMAFVGCLAPIAPARAQTDEPASRPSSEAPPAPSSLPVAIKLVSTPIQAEAVRAAIASELGVSVDIADALVDEGLSVSVQGRRGTVSFRSKQGEVTTRSMNLPANSEQAVEVIALLAGNLARDEASELLARLAPPPPPVTEPEEGADAEGAATAPNSSAEKPTEPAKPVEKKQQPAAAKPKSKKKELDGLIRGNPAAINLSLFYPVTLLDQTERRVMTVEAGLVYSRVGAIEGAGFTFAYLRVEKDVRGAVGAFGWTRVNGDVIGVQWGGLVSEGHGKIRGAELGDIASLRWGNVEGAQASTFFARADDIRGVQGTAGVGWARDVEGVQGSLVTVGRDVTGAQASLVGVARDVTGGQVGLVNVARSADLQLGLVNVAERVDGAAIGLVSIAGNGYIEPTAHIVAGSRDVYAGGVKFVAGLAYSVLAIGAASLEGDVRPLVEAGGGLHVEPPLLRDGPVIDRTAIEVGAHVNVFPTGQGSTEEQTYVHYRAGVGVRFARTVWVFGGYDVSHDTAPFGDIGQGPWAGIAFF